MKKGIIIFLNGVSSSGKTTLAKVITNRLSDFFHLSLDDFDSLINLIEDRKNGRLIPVETEYFYHRTIKMFSDKGIHLVVDHILHNDFTRLDCLEMLKDYPILFIGVHCPIEELERREQDRGNRKIGQARSQLSFVHLKEQYDLEVNTFTDSMEDILRSIENKIKHIEDVKGFKETFLNLNN